MRDLLLLARAPLAATAAANALVGLLLARPAGPWDARALAGALALALASCCLYWAGMALNDVFDLERDRSLHPTRPIPAGRVSRAGGALFGAALLAGGLALGAAAGALLAGAAGALRGLAGAGAVAACVLLYDGWLKRWRLPGSLAMGACRGVNALVGPLAAGALSAPLELGAPGGGLALAYAALLTFYVAALTGVSTLEDEDAPRTRVALAFGATAAAPLAAAALTLVPGGASPLALLGWGPLVWRVAREGAAAAREGTRTRGGRMTIALLRGLWALDLGALLAGLAGAPAAVLAAGLGALAALFALGALARRALFGPPPGAKPAEAGQPPAPLS